MRGSLNEILPEPISPEAEEILREHLKRKMKGAAGLAVRLLHAMESKFFYGVSLLMNRAGSGSNIYIIARKEGGRAA